MFPGVEAQSLSLAELFAEPFLFQIPSYQRPFSWTTQEAEQLLEDIWRAAGIGEDEEPPSSASGYFLGSIVLLRVAGDDGGHFDVVDGQQRLLTLTILFSVLRELAATKAPDLVATLDAWIVARQRDVERFRIAVRGPAGRLFQDAVQHVEAAAADYETPESEPEIRILAVREHFHAELVEENADTLHRLTDYLGRLCHVVSIVTHAIDQAHNIFTVLNVRGKALARGDILKAELLGGVVPDRRLESLAVWERLEQQLGIEFDSLFSHIRTIHGRTRGQVIEAVRDIADAAGGAEAFINGDLADYGDLLAGIGDGGRIAGEAGRRIDELLGYLRWVGNSDWIPPALMWLRRHATEPEALVTFLTSLDRLAVGTRLIGLGTEKRVRRFAALVATLRQGADPMAPAGPLELTRDERRMIQHNLKRLHMRSQQTCKLVLLRLDDAVAGHAQGIDSADLTVEHVLPQHPATTSDWHRQFRDASERDRCVQSLGNLVLVPKEVNKRAKNLDFERKHDAYFRDDTRRLPLLTMELRGQRQWLAADIIEREARLLRAVDELWRLA